MRWLRYFLPILLVSGALAQGAPNNLAAITQQPGNLVAIVPNAKVVVCGFPGTGGTPCTNLASTFTDPTLGSACASNKQVSILVNGVQTCSATTDSAGNFGIFAAPGSYTYYWQNGTIWQGPFIAAIAGTNGGGAVGSVSGTANQIVSTGGPNPVISLATPLTTPGNATIGGSLIAPTTNGTLNIDGTTYPCTATGIAAMLTAAVGKASAEGCTSGFTSTQMFSVGGASTTGISFIHPSVGTWTINDTTSTDCAVKIFNANSFGGAAAVNTGFRLQASATANMDSLLCNDVTGGLYTNAENMLLYNPSGGTFANGLLHLEHLQDGSHFDHITVANYSGIGGKFSNDCCAANFTGLVFNGNYGTGAQPLLITAPDASHTVQGIDFPAVSAVHAGSGISEITITGSNRFWCNGIHFGTAYMEPQKGISDTTTPAFDDNCAGSVQAENIVVNNDDPSSTRYALQLEAGSGGFAAKSIVSQVSTNVVNDLANGVTVTTASAYTPVAYNNIPQNFLKVSFSRLINIAVNAFVDETISPTISSGFGGTPSIVSPNGTMSFDVNVGSGGSATSGVIGFPSGANAARNGWNVHCDDETTQSSTVFVTKQIAHTQTTTTIANFNTSGAQAAWAANDILACVARAF